MNLNNIFSKTSQNTPIYEMSLNGDFDIELEMFNTLKYIEEASHASFMEHTRAVYAGMKLDSPEILTEGLSDFIDSAVAFFKGLLKKIIDFFKKAFAFIMSYIGEFDKFISSHRTELDKLEPNFTLKMYKYTFNSNIPDNRRVNDIIDTYNNELQNVKDLKYDDIVDERDHFNQSGNINNIRGEVLGVNGGVEEENYLKEVKAVYRGGKYEESDETITKSEFSKILNDYAGLKKTLQDAKKEQMDIQNTITSLVRFFDSAPSVYYSGTEKRVSMHSIERTSTGIKHGTKNEVTYDPDKLRILNVFFKFKYEQSKTLCALLTNAHFEKVAAIKEAMAVYRKIVRTALTHKSDKREDVK